MTTQTWKHRLSNIDAKSKTGDCQHCGPNVRLTDTDGRLRCWIGRQKGGTYGNIKLSYEQKVGLWNASSNMCQICQDSLTYEQAHLDHNHQTGHIRGFLCASCNLGLGKFRDNPEILRRASDYVERLGLTESDKGSG